MTKKKPKSLIGLLQAFENQLLEDGLKDVDPEPEKFRKRGNT